MIGFTLAQLTSEVKRINQRYKDLLTTLGAKNELVKVYKKLMDKVSTSSMTKDREDKKTGKIIKGHLAIKSPSKITEDDMLAINKLSQLTTKGEYLKEQKQVYIDMFGEVPTRQELLDFIASLDDIHDFIENNATFIYNVSSSLTGALHRSSNLTKDELREMQKLIKIANDTNNDVVETIKKLNALETEETEETDENKDGIYS